MSAKSERKKAIKAEKRATYGFSSAWEQFNTLPAEERTIDRLEALDRREAREELKTALKAVIRHNSPLFTVRKEGR